MSRALRVEFPGAIYHTMARGVARMPLFRDDRDRFAFLREVEIFVRKGLLIAHSLCMMLNHIHLLCETPFAGLGRIIHDILGNYASRFNRRHNRVGHLFQGRYKAILVQDGIYLLQSSRYIHLNPRNAGIETPDSPYPWSSYPNFMGRESVVPWVCTERILSHFPTPAAYRDFVESQEECALNPFDLATAGIAYGDEKFVRLIGRQACSQSSHHDQPSFHRLQKIIVTPTIDEIRTAVESVFVDESPCRQRRYFIWALRAFAWLKGCEIANIVGLKRSAISAALHSVEELRLAENSIAMRLDNLAVFLQKNGAESPESALLRENRLQPNGRIKCLLAEFRG